VVEKPYSDPNKNELIGYYWSGKQGKAIKGINLITLYYTDMQGNSFPVNYRIYKKEEGKTKNDYKVFSRTFRNGKTKYWIWFQVDESRLEEISRADFRELFSIHWGIESYHRALKQLCNLGKFMVRKAEAVKTHFFCSLRAFCQLELMRIQEQIESWYEPQRNLYLQVTREYIVQHFSPDFQCIS
ncbi:MAG: IS701 family transposase, partial [Cyanobacteria bacterium P01_E01_bin.42]